MTSKGHRSTPENAMHHTARESLVTEMRETEPTPTTCDGSARLQTIHELVRSGDYHIPASAIADRIVERMMVSKRGGKV